ncbi:MAG: hypothetical protein GF418_03485 [Chitinivibrionales bacterium]|nr:hypothetical protein [Chitinivibrionales bacterium]MBD3394666.1 hypothetical protein [Chitinivibrionales bacterium]
MQVFLYARFAFFLLILVASPAFSLPAFPGAEGFGSETPGGRGGDVLCVTSLDDDGSAGTFRWAVDQIGPRIVVFKTGGIVTLDRPMDIENPYITIAGQTAPGDGICLKGGRIAVRTHDVIVRGMRVRVGDAEGTDVSVRDGIAVLGMSDSVYNVVIDHCSFSWAIDENASMNYTRNSDITFQWCIFSEGLLESIHHEGELHAMGLLLSGTAKNVSLHHCLFAHNYSRNPMVNADGLSLEMINNVIYNWQADGTTFTGTGNIHTANIIGNCYRVGPQSDSTHKRIKAFYIRDKDPDGSSFYLHDNLGPTRPDDSYDEWDIVLYRDGDDKLEQFKSAAPVFAGSGITAQSAADAYGSVLSYAGALAPARDAVDDRVARQVIDGNGHIIDSQDEVGGWPVYASGPAPADADNDGMPDAWETARDLSPENDGDAAADRDSDGYTNIEEYINSLFPAQPDTTVGFSPEPDPPPPPATSLDGVTLVRFEGATANTASLRTAAEGDSAYPDRPYVLARVPASCEGAVTVFYPNDDKSNTADTFMVLATGHDARIRVAYDGRASSLPDWLAEWDATRDTVIGNGYPDDDTCVYPVYETAVDAGDTMVLGGNRAGNESDDASLALFVSYLVFVDPAAGSALKRLVPPAQAEPALRLDHTARALRITHVPPGSRIGIYTLTGAHLCSATAATGMTLVTLGTLPAVAVVVRVTSPGGSVLVRQVMALP